MSSLEPENSEVSRKVNLLGGQRTLHRVIHSRLEAHDLLRDGLPGLALKHLVNEVAILRAPHVADWKRPSVSARGPIGAARMPWTRR